MNYMDFHCDTLGMFGKGPDQGNLYENSGAVRSRCQMWSCWLPSPAPGRMWSAWA